MYIYIYIYIHIHIHIYMLHTHKHTRTRSIIIASTWSIRMRQGPAHRHTVVGAVATRCNTATHCNLRHQTFIMGSSLMAAKDVSNSVLPSGCSKAMTADYERGFFILLSLCVHAMFVQKCMHYVLCIYVDMSRTCIYNTCSIYTYPAHLCTNINNLVAHYFVLGRYPTWGCGLIKTYGHAVT